MGGRLIDSLGTTDALSDLFSDLVILQTLLDVEASLARAQARVGVIPAAAADVIAAAAVAHDFDVAGIAREARHSGTPVIPLVRALTTRVQERSEHAARFVHFGATSQDISDTAMVICLSRAHNVIAEDATRLASALRRQSNAHAATVMLGRTLLQPAAPMTFGLKAAGWYAAVERGRTILSAAAARARVVQFGGAAGTLAALGVRGPAVAEALARDLNLDWPGAPWHAHRDRLAHLVCACGVFTGTLGKIARDVSLLMQAEVGEVFEPGGGSSSMPHKRNPSACAVVLAAAVRLPGLVSAFLSGMVQEHERGLGGMHAEWATLAAVMQATGAAASALAGAIEGLEVDPDRMRANMDRTRGAVFAERVMMRLVPVMGRDRAHDVLSRALEIGRAREVSLAAGLADIEEIRGLISPEEIARMDRPEEYLGEAESLRTRLLASDTA